jgi:protein SCO1
MTNSSDDDTSEGAASGVTRSTKSQSTNAQSTNELNPVARLFSKPMTWVVVALIMFAAPFAGALSRTTPEAPKVFGTLPAFELTNSRGEPFGSKELEGAVYIANFVFTSCPSICPALMDRMNAVQKRVKNTSGMVRLVTITVDPETDTPEKMAAYGKRFGARPSRWHLLTGDYQVIEETVVKGFKLAMGKDAENLFQIFHSERFVLVDRRGRIRGYFEATDEGIDEMMRATGLVLNLPVE